MDIRRLEIFCRVVELKSFTRAAEACLLSQPTVSEHIRQLEEAVEDKLLDRLGRQALPTPAGEILYRYARQIIQLRDEALQAMENYKGKVSGTLNIGASTIPGAYILPTLIEAFKSANPSIRLTLKISGTGAIGEALLQGQVELAIIGAKSKEQQLECRDIYSDELILVMHPSHPLAGQGPVSLDQLEGQPFLLREEGSGTRIAMAEALGFHKFDLSRRGSASPSSPPSRCRRTSATAPWSRSTSRGSESTAPSTSCSAAAASSPPSPSPFSSFS